MHHCPVVWLELQDMSSNRPPPKRRNDARDDFNAGPGSAGSFFVCPEPPFHCICVRYYCVQGSIDQQEKEHEYSKRLYCNYLIVGVASPLTGYFASQFSRRHICEKSGGDGVGP